MKTLACGVAVALLAGCGGSQPPIGAPGTTRQTALVTHAERGKSWMLPEAKNRNLLKSKSPSLNGNVGSNDVRLQQASKRALLYASLDTSIGIYTYPDGKAVGTIQTTYGPESVCNGNSGDIWVATSFRYAYEFKRGNEHPIETADTGTDAPITSCAVSPTDGKLALAAYSVGIFIFEKDRGSLSYMFRRLRPIAVPMTIMVISSLTESKASVSPSSPEDRSSSLTLGLTGVAGRQPVGCYGTASIWLLRRQFVVKS